MPMQRERERERLRVDRGMFIHDFCMCKYGISI